MDIKMTSVIVSDPVKAHEFYTGTLGFQSLMFEPDYKLAIVVSKKRPDGVALMLEPNESDLAKNFQTAIYEKGLPCIVFGSDDVKSEYAQLKEKGVKFTKEPTVTEWGTLAMFEDGFGNIIQIHENE